MYGVYKIYKDGELVAESKNKLTLLGRSNALSAMLGLAQSFAGSFGIGISNKANTAGTFHEETDLYFNVGKYPVSAASLGQSGSDDALVYTARITDPSRYVIHELGLFSNQISASVDVDSLTLLNFETGDGLREDYLNVSYYIEDETNASSRKASVVSDLINYRIGSNAVNLKVGGTIYINDYSSDLTDFYPLDILRLACYNSSATSITITFYSGASNYTVYTFSSLTAGYDVYSKEKSVGTVTGTMDWSNITKIEITAAGGSGAYVILDGLKVVKNKPVDSIDGLVSRTALTQSITKEAGSVIDIEYLLLFNLG